MAKKRQAPTSYERLGQRIQDIINAPRAQAEHCAEISRLRWNPEEALS